MADLDLKNFLKERLQLFDPTLDTSDGSTADLRVIQPLLARLGADPFTVDVRAFLLDLLNQRFPDTPTGDQDAISELFILTSELMLAPFKREIQRLRQNQSLQNPTTLSIDEAESLGGNYFVERPKGDRATGKVRAYYRNPRGLSVTSANVATTRSNLGFVPVTEQGISADQMLFNTEGSLYFMDIAVQAVQPGDQYNVEPGEIIAMLGLEDAIRVTNLSRFRNGVKEATAEDYVEIIRKSLGEQSMVTAPGLFSQSPKALPEITRMALVGADDPRMRRDILRGSSLGPILLAGTGGRTLGDGEGHMTSRRFQINTAIDSGIDFLTLQATGKLVLLVHSLFLDGEKAKDIEVRSILGADTLELEESLLPLTLSGAAWSLRRRELRLNRVPGGILAPDARGEAVLPPDAVHVGGMFDAYARSAAFDATSLVLSEIEDQEPALEGATCNGTGSAFSLTSLVYGTDYLPGSTTFQRLAEAVEGRYALQILDGPGAGVYDLLSLEQVVGFAPGGTIYGEFPVAVSGSRWKILDQINFGLTDPKLRRTGGTDLEVTQGQDQVTTASLLDFSAYGVVAGDMLRILAGEDKGDYPVIEVAGAPAYSRIKIDRTLTRSASGLSYEVFRPNPGGSLEPPLIRFTDVAILDSSGQPTGAKVPFGGAIGAAVTAMTNPARGVKLEVPDALVGIISQSLPAGAALVGKTLQLLVYGLGLYTVTFAGVNPLSVTQIADQINTAIGVPLASVIGTRMGINPYNGLVEVVGGTLVGTSALPLLFGGMYYLTSRMVRSPSFSADTFTALSPPLTLSYDVLELRSGRQVGPYGMTRVSPFPLSNPLTSPSPGLTVPPCVELETPGIFPEADVRVVLGARTLGTARFYFLDPTTAEAGPQTVCTFDPEGLALKFKPDPSFSTTLIPAAPQGVKPLDGSCLAGEVILTTSLDSVKKRVRPGDVLQIDFTPIIGGVLADPVPNLAFTRLLFSFGQDATREVVFVNDSDAIPATDVTRDGVVSQINRALGATVAAIGPGSKIEFNPTFLVVVRKTGTANALLGLSTTVDLDNRSANAGTYVINTPRIDSLVLDTPLPATETRMQFSIVRRGSQRLGSTGMSAQKGEGGLYYMDVELVSEGTGDQYNLPTGSSLEVAGCRVDGYTLRTRNPELSFSPLEDVDIVFSRSINEVGTNDDPEEATYLTGRSFALSGDRSSLIASYQTYLQADTQRDICANPLARCLLPHFVRFTLPYTGGPKPSALLPVLESHVHALFPEDSLEVASLVSKVRQEGATAVVSPLTLFAVVYRQDRRVTLERSQDRINVDALAAFYPDQLLLIQS